MMILTALSIGGCALDEDLSETSQEVQSDNGIRLNGIRLNGIRLNGTSLSAVNIEGVSIYGQTANGSWIKASTTSGQPLTGTNIVGTTWTAALSDGSTLPLRIDSATAGASPNNDIWMYGISYETATGWAPLCTDSSGAAVQANSLSGLWNQQQGVSGGGAYSSSTTQFTLACRGASIAKCEELGYKPWKYLTNQLTSCVRLLRADFCGNGQSWTVDGQQVNLYDKVGIELDTMAWQAEAEWTPYGARCINGRSLAYSRYLATGTTPTCIASRSLTISDRCGSFNTGVYMVSELSAN